LCNGVRKAIAPERRILVPELRDLYRQGGLSAVVQAAEERSEWNIYLEADPPLDSLQSDRRWKELICCMDMPVEGAETERQAASWARDALIERLGARVELDRHALSDRRPLLQIRF
jgi:hypothetical protein